MNVRRMVVVVAFWALLVLALWISDAQPAVLLLAGVVAAIGIGLFAVLDLADAVDEVEWTRRSRRPASLPQRTDPRVSALKRKAQGTWWSSSTELGDTLVELIDDRLLAHHHVDRSTDPAAASAVLTPALRSLVAQPRRSSMSPRELDQLLSDIEAL